MNDTSKQPPTAAKFVPDSAEAASWAAILLCPFLRAGVRPAFPMDEPSVKRLLGMFGVRATDHLLERYATDRPGAMSKGWVPTTLLDLLEYVNVRPCR